MIYGVMQKIEIVMIVMKQGRMEKDRALRALRRCGSLGARESFSPRGSKV